MDASRKTTTGTANNSSATLNAPATGDASTRRALRELTVLGIVLVHMGVM